MSKSWFVQELSSIAENENETRALSSPTSLAHSTSTASMNNFWQYQIDYNGIQLCNCAFHVDRNLQFNSERVVKWASYVHTQWKVIEKLVSVMLRPSSAKSNNSWRESENVINSVISSSRMLILFASITIHLLPICQPFVSIKRRINQRRTREITHEKLISFSINKTTPIHIHFVFFVYPQQSRIINQFLHFSLCTLFSPVRHLTHNFIIIKHDTVSIFMCALFLPSPWQLTSNVESCARAGSVDWREDVSIGRKFRLLIEVLMLALNATLISSMEKRLDVVVEFFSVFLPIIVT